MSDKFAEENAKHFDPAFLLKAGGPRRDPLERERVNGKVHALVARGEDARVETVHGPGILDRVARDGVAYVWFGQLAPSMWWSRTIQQQNEKDARDYHASIEAGVPMAKPVEQECRVLASEKDERIAAGEDIVFVESTGSRIVHEMHVDHITDVSEEEHNKGIETFRLLEQQRLEASPKRRRQIIDTR